MRLTNTTKSGRCRCSTGACHTSMLKPRCSSRGATAATATPAGKPMEPASCDWAPQTTPTRISGWPARRMHWNRNGSSSVEKRDQTNSTAKVNPKEHEVKTHCAGRKLLVACLHEPEPISVARCRCDSPHVSDDLRKAPTVGLWGYKSEYAVACKKVHRAARDDRTQEPCGQFGVKSRTGWSRF